MMLVRPRSRMVQLTPSPLKVTRVRIHWAAARRLANRGIAPPGQPRPALSVIPKEAPHSPAPT
jgi:hypothetical protein